MIVGFSFLACGAEIEIFANAAFVPGADDWEHFAALAFHLWVSHICNFLLVYLITVFKLLEDLLTLLFELFLDEALENFSRHTLFASVYRLFFI